MDHITPTLPVVSCLYNTVFNNQMYLVGSVSQKQICVLLKTRIHDYESAAQTNG